MEHQDAMRSGHDMNREFLLATVERYASQFWRKFFAALGLSYLAYYYLVPIQEYVASFDPLERGLAYLSAAIVFHGFWVHRQTTKAAIRQAG